MVKYPPFTTKLQNDQIRIEKNDSIFSPLKHHKALVYVRAGLRIGKAKFSKEAPLKGTEKEIIKQIHTIRFYPQNPYVITGGHFYQLFVRNLGIFYNALLDSRIPCSQTDWLNREKIALKTVALDLAIFDLAGKEYTTIVPIRNNIFTCINLYARPSDSLFAILYTLLALSDDTFLETIFPAKKLTKKMLHTKQAAYTLYTQYETLLKNLITAYLSEVVDPATHLVKTHVLLASARDGIKRQSSFYDNVIAWATVRFAKQLHLYQINESELEQWRKKIIEIFWDTKEGIFIDDLSNFSKEQKIFSADSFIVLSTGFLNLNNTNDMHYLQQIVSYVKDKKLDTPLPLHYSTLDLPKNLYRPVRHFAPSYMGTSIWSHWGMEYIKTLIYLGMFKTKYWIEAKRHLESYKKNIVQYGGYPEVYDKNGDILHSRLYRSVLHNGWVINYEQTKMLLKAAIAESH